MRARNAVSAVVAAALLAGCGSRLSQDELIALNGGPVATIAPDVTNTGAVAQPGGPAVGAGIPATTGGAPAVASPGVATPAPGATTAGSGQTTGKGDSTNGGANAAGGAPAAAVKTDNQPITVCSVSELGGPVGAAVARGVNGMQSWVGDVNARGGVNGHRIRLIVKDSGSDPNVALAQVRACVENEGAVALVGSMAPLTAKGFQPYLEAKGVPAIGGECGTTVWSSSPAFFTQCPKSETTVWGLAYEAAHSGTPNRKLGFLYCSEAQSCAEGKNFIVDQKFAQQNGLDLVYTKEFSLAQLDFTAECAAMKAADITTVLTIVDPSGIQRMGQSCSRQGFNPVWVQPYAGVYADSPAKPGLGNMRLVMPTMPFCCMQGKDAQIPVYQRYLTAAERYAGVDNGPAVVLGFTAGLLFERFLDEIAKTTPTVTSAALMKAASGIKKEDLGGAVPPINLTTGQPTPDSKCWFTMVSTDSTRAFTVPEGLKQFCRR